MTSNLFAEIILLLWDSPDRLFPDGRDNFLRDHPTRILASTPAAPTSAQVTLATMRDDSALPLEGFSPFPGRSSAPAAGLQRPCAHSPLCTLPHLPTCETPVFPLKLIKTWPCRAFPDHLCPLGTSCPSFFFAPQLVGNAFMSTTVLHLAVFACPIFTKRSSFQGQKPCHIY